MTEIRDHRILLANSALGIVGDTGSGKTTLLATMAEYVFRTYGMVSRLYSFDAGGYGDLMASLVRKGIVQLWRVRTRDLDGALGLPTGTCDLAAKGYWPQERDPLTGDTQPNCDLVAPYVAGWTMRCKEGHDVLTVGNQSLLQGPPRPCPTCKALTSMADCKGITKKLSPVGGIEKVGCMMYDGGTSMSDWVMSDMNQRAGRDELGGEKGNMRTQTSSGLSYGIAGRGGVGFAQNRAQDWINFAIALPGMVVPPVFTFLEQQATEDGLAIYGPKIAGNAKTGEVPGWLGNCWNTAIVIQGGVKEHRLYLQSYRLPTEIGTHKCKSRAAVGTMPEYLADPEGATLDNGKAYTQFNLGVGFELLLSALTKTDARADAMFPDAPGLDSGKVEAPIGAVQKAGAPVAGRVIRTAGQVKAPVQGAGVVAAESAALAAGQIAEAPSTRPVPPKIRTAGPGAPKPPAVAPVARKA